MELPTLYGLDSKGGVKVWEVEPTSTGFTVSHGKLGGKIQVKHTVCKPKNVGRANETTVEEQGAREAIAKWRKQTDKGYVMDQEELEKAPLVLNPMLAMDYNKNGHRIDYGLTGGVYCQPKLDGVRCEAYLDEAGKLVFKSRGGKFYSVPTQIYNEMIHLFAAEPCMHLDGELYIHGESLQDIVSAVKKPNELTSKLEFHCFDIASEGPTWVSRMGALEDLDSKYSGDFLVFVQGSFVASEEQMYKLHDEYVEQGYEGVMVRQGNGEYRYNYRSPALQKFKKMQDEEFKIIGHEVDKDGCIVWVISVASSSGELTCKVTPKMTKQQRKDLVEVATSYYGKLLKVQFQARTKDGNLQFPIGIELDRTDNK